MFINWMDSTQYYIRDTLVEAEKEQELYGGEILVSLGTPKITGHLRANAWSTGYDCQRLLEKLDVNSRRQVAQQLLRLALMAETT